MKFSEYTDTERIEDSEVREIFRTLRELSEEVYSNLGAGFTEDMYQRALQIEMREKGIRFQREVSVEIFYKNVPLGFDRPDFIIRPFRSGNIILSKPIVVELKTVKKLSAKNIVQGKTYLRSLPHASDNELKQCKHCFLVNFPDTEEGSVEIILIERL